MPQRLDMRSPDFGTAFAALLAMKREAAEDVDQAVQKIIADVVARGDAALVDYSQKFDRVDLGQARPCASAERDRRRRRGLSAPEALAALRLAHERIIVFHERQRPQDLQSSPMRSASNSAGAGGRSRRSGFMFRAARRAIPPRC